MPVGYEGERADLAEPAPAPAGDDRPIARLRPGSDLHAKVLEKLLERLRMSERAMSGE